MYEAGVAINTKFIGTELNLEPFGKTPASSSFDFMARVKVGLEKIMLEIGTEWWISEIFEDDDFNMTSVYVGLRFNF